VVRLPLADYYFTTNMSDSKFNLLSTSA